MPGKPSLDRPACRAHTHAGRPCRNRAAAGSAYCGVHGGATRKVGVPSKITRELADTILSNVERGATYRVAAEAAGLHPSTVHEWRERGEHDLEHGTPSLFAYLVDELTRARAGGEVGLIAGVRSHVPADWRAAAWLLERMHPERWARRDYLDVDVAERAAPRTVTPEEPAARARILELLATATRPPAPET